MNEEPNERIIGELREEVDILKEQLSEAQVCVEKVLRRWERGG